MPPQGGGDFEHIEIGRAVVYMANSGGAKFPIPERPAAAGAAPADGAAAPVAAATGEPAAPDASGGCKRQVTPSARDASRTSRPAGRLFHAWRCADGLIT